MIRHAWPLALILSFQAGGLCAPLAAQIRLENPKVTKLKEMGLSRPQGVAYHPVRGTLFILGRTRMHELTMEAELLKTTPLTDPISDWQGISYDPVGGGILIARPNGELHRFDPEAGTVQFVLRLPFVRDASGFEVDPATGHFWAVDDDARSINEFDRDGFMLNAFTTRDMIPEFKEPQGLGFYGDHLLISDDGGGTKILYLVSRKGFLLEFVADLTEFGIEDPEGVTVAGEDRVCVVSDSDSRLLCLDVVKTAVPQNQLSAPNDLGIEGTFIGVAVTNTVVVENDALIEGRDSLGRTSSPPLVFRPLPSQGQTAFLTSELQGLQDSQLLTLRGLRGPILGFFMVGDFELKRLDGVGGRLPASNRLDFLHLRHTPGAVRTRLFLINTSKSQDASVELKAFDEEGVEVASIAGPIDAGGSFLGDLGALFGPEFALDGGYLRLTSDVPLQGFEAVDDGKSFVSAGGFAPSPTLNLMAPHFFFGEGIGDTALELLNREERTIRLQVSIFPDQGEGAATLVEIGPRSFRRLGLLERFGLNRPGLTQGHLTVTVLPEEPLEGQETATQPRIADISALLAYSALDGETGAALPMVTAGLRREAFPHVAQAANVFQGLAIQNPNPQAVTAKVRVYDREGKELDSVSVPLEAGQRAIGLLNEPIFFGPDFAQEGGYLKIHCDLPVVNFTLFGGEYFLSALQGQESFN